MKVVTADGGGVAIGGASSECRPFVQPYIMYRKRVRTAQYKRTYRNLHEVIEIQDRLVHILTT